MWLYIIFVIIYIIFALIATKWLLKILPKTRLRNSDFLDSILLATLFLVSPICVILFITMLPICALGKLLEKIYV